uniref:Uncharacterized protein n=1 Tax=Phytophthora ramorum TaxID=164328 RepID=H3GLT1_PHYRM
MPPRAGSRSRRRSSDKLPALRPSGSNQRDADAVAQWDDRHRRLRRRKRRELEPLPQLARRCPSSSDSSEVDDSSASVSDEDVRVPPSTITTMRSQRMRSLAAMSKLQYDAATTIQQAQDFLDIFLRQEVTNLVPVCLLDVLRETCSQEATTTKRREDLAASLAGSVLSSLIDECIRDVFHGVLQAMVKAYLVQRLDLSRAATPPVHAVAADVLNDWVKELVAELLPEVIVELTSEYTARQQHEQIWEELLHDELQSLAADAVPVNSTTSALQQTDQVNSADNAHSNPPL